jgi:hypothetical protein
MPGSLSYGSSEISSVSSANGLDGTGKVVDHTHELTIARDVLRTRRRIAAQPPDEATTVDAIQRAVAIDPEGEGDVADDVENLPGVAYAAIDAVLARSEAAIAEAKKPGQAPADPLVCDLDWDEEEWRTVLRQAKHLPAALQAIVALDGWNEPSVLHHAPWLGRLFSASILRQAGVTSGAHLAAINHGLKTMNTVTRHCSRPFGHRRDRAERP